jgi:hypothetical protein
MKVYQDDAVFVMRDESVELLEAGDVSDGHGAELWSGYLQKTVCFMTKYIGGAGPVFRICDRSPSTWYSMRVVR